MKKFGSDELTGKFFDFYVSQVDLLKRLCANPDFNHVSGRMSSLYLLFFSLYSTGSSISLLAKGHFLNESLMITRSFLEKSINYLYLLYCDEKEYLKYLEYSKQKQLRMRNRSFSVGELTAEFKWSGSIDFTKEPELKKALDKFTSKTGKEIKRWSTVSLADKLAVIAPKIGSDIGFLMLGVLGFYEDASEALHGTLYGTALPFGRWQLQIPSTVTELSEIWNKQFSNIFLTLGTCIHTLINAIHREVQIEDIKMQSVQNVQLVGKWSPWQQ